MTEAMNGHFDSGFRYAQAFSKLGVRSAARREHGLEFSEDGQAACRGLLGFQFGEHVLQKRERPAPFEELIGAQRCGRFGRITLLGIEGNDLPVAAALPGASAVPFVGEKAFERD